MREVAIPEGVAPARKSRQGSARSPVDAVFDSVSVVTTLHKELQKAGVAQAELLEQQLGGSAVTIAVGWLAR